jgi:hypothetical protein
MASSLLHHCDEAVMKTASLSYTESLRAIGESLELRSIGFFK